MAIGVFQTGQFGLDIGGSSLVAVHVTGKPGRLKLRACYEWPLPDDIVVDGEVVEVDLFSRELKTFVVKHRLRGRAVHLAVSNQKVIVRNIDLPEMTTEELRGAIEFQAQDYIPIPIDEVVLDYQLLGKRMAPDGVSRQEVLLVAAQRAMITNLLSAVRRAGLKVAGIDVASLALIRALVPSPSFLAAEGDTGVCRALADVSSSVCTLVVAEDRMPRFARVINFSSDRFARALAESRGIPFDDAQLLVQRVGLAGPLPPDTQYYSDVVIAETQERLLQ
ncbi:MAG: type IV pilus assembly protein PilM, partial [Thermoleophilia bacterium]|nr:type IV pilus assembly protein PilM [Thermoleophilia bacterium]